MKHIETPITPKPGQFVLHGDQTLSPQAAAAGEDWNVLPDGTWVDGSAAPGQADTYVAGNIKKPDGGGGTTWVDRGPIVYDAASGNDLIVGYTQDDQLTGGAGDDALFGGAGSDTISGGDGNDFIRSGMRVYATADYGGPDLWVSGTTPWVQMGQGGLSIVKDSNGQLLSSNLMDNDYVRQTGGSYALPLENPADRDVVNGGAGNDYINSSATLSVQQRDKPADSWSPPAGQSVLAKGPGWGTYNDTLNGQAVVVWDGTNDPTGSDDDVVDGGAVAAMCGWAGNSQSSCFRWRLERTNLQAACAASTRLAGHKGLGRRMDVAWGML